MHISGSSAAQSHVDIAAEFFKKIDSDGSGGITKDELASAIAERRKTDGANQPDVADIFARVDTSGDGVIDATENGAAMRQHAVHGPRPPQPAELAKSIFETADEDGDGTLTLFDLQSAFAEHDAAGLERLFTQADSDGDGSITAADLESAFKTVFEQSIAYDRRGQVHTAAE